MRSDCESYGRRGATAKEKTTDPFRAEKVADFGANVSFEGELGIWDENYALNTIFKEKQSKSKLKIIMQRSILNPPISKSYLRAC